MWLRNKKIKTLVFEWSRLKGVNAIFEPFIIVSLFSGLFAQEALSNIFNLAYLYHLPRSNRSWDMTVWPVWVSAFWSKFSDPYFGPASTQKSKIFWEFFSWYLTTSPKIIQIGDGHVGWPCWFDTEWPTSEFVWSINFSIKTMHPILYVLICKFWFCKI